MTVEIDKETIEFIRCLKPSIAGRIAYYCLPYRKKVIIENMQRVFGAVLTNAEIKKLAQCYYGHLLTSIREMIQSRFKTMKRLQESVIVQGVEHLFSAAEKGKGVLILTGHFGSWEVAPIAGLSQFQDYYGRIHFIRKTLAFKWLEKILFRRYFNAGLRVIPKKQALSQVITALSHKDAVVFVLDQAASIQNKQGVPTEFFNHPVGTYRSLATIARSTGAPVVPGTSFRLPDGRHIMRFLPALEWIAEANPKQEIIVNTNQYNRVLEQLVLEHPDQWLWLHRRWKC